MVILVAYVQQQAFVMLTGSVNQGYRQGTMGLPNLCSTVSRPLVGDTRMARSDTNTQDRNLLKDSSFTCLTAELGHPGYQRIRGGRDKLGDWD